MQTLSVMRRTAALTGTSPFIYYYRGGFDQTMSRREAALILGVREFAPASQVKDAHRRIMIANHPDRGGSPYLAAKINEANVIMRAKT